MRGGGAIVCTGYVNKLEHRRAIIMSACSPAIIVVVGEVVRPTNLMVAF
jgi:hypothetical protein